MLLQFDKYHGAGNDFIMIDCRNSDISVFTKERVSFLCDRHFGIGADGLILLTQTEEADFRMIYFNSDGQEGTMCGNGGRCITAFAEKLGIVSASIEFIGIDGKHQAKILGKGNYSLKMIDVKKVERQGKGYLLETGSTHYLEFRKNINELDVFKEGREIRYQDRFGCTGTNVNFIENINDTTIKIRTYERGVENETLACGTGSVAAALTSYINSPIDKKSYKIIASGGELQVNFKTDDDISFYDIWLTGPAKFVFSGKIELGEIDH